MPYWAKLPAFAQKRPPFPGALTALFLPSSYKVFVISQSFEIRRIRGAIANLFGPLLFVAISSLPSSVYAADAKGAEDGIEKDR